MIKKITVFKFLILVILTCITIISLQLNEQLKSIFYKQVLTDNISFVSFNNWYKENFGDILPFVDHSLEEPVFNEKLKYDEITNFKDGYELKVSINYLIPSIDTGIVTYIGEKEGYGNTLIVEYGDGLVIWYSNLENINLNMYDYVKKSQIIGEVDNVLYLVFYKNGEIVSYENYI